MFDLFAKWRQAHHLALWQKRDNRAVGVDVGHASAKVVQLRKDHGQAILETYGEMALGPYSDLAIGQVANLSVEKTVDLLQALSQEAGVLGKTVAMSIPLRSSLLTILELPELSRNNLDRVVPIEARKYVPVPISEVELDWWMLPETQMTKGSVEKRHLEVLVAAIHRDIINQYQEIGKRLGWSISFLEVETFSAIRSVFSGALDATVILDIGAGTTKLSIVDYGVVRVSHTISKGSQDISMALSRTLGVDFAKAEEIKRKVGLNESVEDGRLNRIASVVVEYIFAEANKVMTMYQAKHKRAMSKIVLIGNGALLRGLEDMAKESFDVPIELGRPFDKTEYPAFLEKMLSTTGPGFAVALGLALRQIQELD